MEVVLAAIRLLTRAFEALKAYLDLKGSGYGGSDHPNARTEHRPKHLRK